MCWRWGAAEAGDVLVVAVHDDDMVRKEKGKRRPVVPLEQRMKIVAAMEPVDYVTHTGGTGIERIVTALKPDVLAVGARRAAGPPREQLVNSYGGKVIAVGGPKSGSSSRLIERIAEMR